MVAHQGYSDTGARVGRSVVYRRGDGLYLRRAGRMQAMDVNAAGMGAAGIDAHVAVLKGRVGARKTVVGARKRPKRRPAAASA